MPKYRITAKRGKPADIKAPPSWARFTWSEDEVDAIFSAPARKANPNHKPGGGKEGGRFTSPGDMDPGAPSEAMKVRDRLGNEVTINEKSSLAANIVMQPDGSYVLSPEREKLHQEIVNKFLDGVKRADGPVQMFMTGGGTAAGKSTMLEAGDVGELPTTMRPESPLDTPEDKAAREKVMAEGGAKAVLIDPDAIKGQIPEYVQKLQGKDASAAAFAHEESSMLSKRLQAAAIAGNYNVVLDTTGDSSIEKLKTQITKYRDAGYNIRAYYATNRVALAQQLALARGEKTGRFVPPTMIEEIHANVSRTFPKAVSQNLFDSVHLYNTDIKGNARLIGVGDRTSFTVKDPELYREFLAKGDSPYATTKAEPVDPAAEKPVADKPVDNPADKPADGATEDYISTNDLELIVTTIALGGEQKDCPVNLTKRMLVFWDKIAAEIAAAPEGMVIDIGKENYDPARSLTGLVPASGRDKPVDENAPPSDSAPKDAPVDNGDHSQKQDLHPGAIKNEQWVTIKRIDNEKRIVYGEVYAPYVLDTYGEFMTPEDIELMAHRFMRLDLKNVIDTQHDNIANGSYPVESFVAREGDPEYSPGAWVLGVHVPDDSLWMAVKRGNLNGFSFQCLVKPTSVDVEILSIRDFVGETELHEDHSHSLFVELDEIGNVISGRTSKAADGHFHDITRASTTERAGGHIHRFFL